MDASYKIQRGIHVHLIQFFMCPEFWVHINWQRPAFVIKICRARCPHRAAEKRKSIHRKPVNDL